MDRSRLMQAFVDGSPVRLKDVSNGQPVSGRIDSIQREDGSGYRFIVRLYGMDRPLYVECPRPQSR